MNDLVDLQSQVAQVCRYRRFQVTQQVVGLDDFIQECNMRLILSYRRFDPSKGNLKTFVWLIVRQVDRDTRRKKRPPYVSKANLNEVPTRVRMDIMELRVAIEELDEPYKSVMRMAADGYTPSEIRKDLGLSSREYMLAYNSGLERLRGILS